MLFHGKPIDEINEDDLNNLIGALCATMTETTLPKSLG